MIKSTDIKSLEYSEILSLYKDFVNPQQAKLFAGLSTNRSVPIKAAGIDITLANGEIIKDFTGGLGVLNHGHNHPKILETRTKFQKNKHMEVSKLYLSPYVAALSKNIAELFPSNLDISYFCNSGAEAIEGALKICHKSFNNKRNVVLSSDRSFHGKTMGALSVSNSDEMTYKFPQLLENKIFKFNNSTNLKSIVESSLDKSGNSSIFAILVEPFSASSFALTSDDFLIKAREISDKYSIPLIFDEIYTGFFKTGPLFNFMRTSAVPDVVVYSKSFGGGKSSISGYTTTKNLFNSSYGNTNDALMHSTTYNAFGEETLTAIVAIEIALEEEFEKKSKNLQNLLETGFNKLSERYKFFYSFAGMGALYGLEFELPEVYKQLEKIFQNLDKKFFKKLYVGALIDHLYSEHNILTYFTDNKKVCLAISPSLITSEKDINKLFDPLDKTFDKNQFTLVNKFIKNVGIENLKLIFK